MKNTRQTLSSISRQSQRGAVLIISMLILLVLTIVSLSSSESVLLQERMTGTSREATLALMAAEQGLDEAEDFVADMDKAILPYFKTKGPFYSTADGPDPKSYFAHDGPFADGNGEYVPATWNVYPGINGVDEKNMPKSRMFMVYGGEFKVDNERKDFGNFVSNSTDASSKAHYFEVVAMGISRDGTTKRVIRTYFVADL